LPRVTRWETAKRQQLVSWIDIGEVLCGDDANRTANAISIRDDTNRKRMVLEGETKK
jgi:hypothetical protein